MSYDVHPVADLFPMLPADELAELAADIAERGLLQPIIIDDQGRILDGRNRLAACEIADVEPTFEAYKGDDPAGYALATNVHRRMLSKGQRAMLIATQSINFMDGETPSQGYVYHARMVSRHAPELVDLVISGKTPLHEAYTTAKERKALREQAPDLADAVAEDRMTVEAARAEYQRRQQEEREADERAAGRLRELVNGWVQIPLPPADDPRRNRLLNLLNERDRDVVLEIDAVYEQGRQP
jgi:hypothetical protein